MNFEYFSIKKKMETKPKVWEICIPKYCACVQQNWNKKVRSKVTEKESHQNGINVKYLMLIQWKSAHRLLFKNFQIVWNFTELSVLLFSLWIYLILSSKLCVYTVDQLTSCPSTDITYEQKKEEGIEVNEKNCQTKQSHFENKAKTLVSTRFLLDTYFCFVNSSMKMMNNFIQRWTTKHECFVWLMYHTQFQCQMKKDRIKVKCGPIYVDNGK